MHDANDARLGLGRTRTVDGLILQNVVQAITSGTTDIALWIFLVVQGETIVLAER
jgi:hypothetical protein